MALTLSELIEILNPDNPELVAKYIRDMQILGRAMVDEKATRKRGEPCYKLTRKGRRHHNWDGRPQSERELN